MAAIVCDTGALIAIDRGDRRIGALLKVAAERRVDVVTSCACVSESWRNPVRQTRLVRALAGMVERPVDPGVGRASGVLLGRAGLSDPADAAVCLLAGPGDTVLTSDPGDIALLLDAAQTKARVLAI